MPEGHVIHRLAQEQTPILVGAAVVVTSPQGRFAAGAQRLTGRRLSAIDAYGKHLLYRFGSDALHVHLGLFGRFFVLRPADPPAETIRVRFVARRTAIDLRGPAACDLLDPDAVDALLARLGPDPLRPDADPQRAYARIARSRVPIGQALLDQRVVAGAGNIFRAEVLFRAGIDPYRPSNTVTEAEWKQLWTDLVDLMEYGLREGRIDTVRPEQSPEATGRAPRRDRHGGEVYVYRRAGMPCLVCGEPVRVAELAGRNLFWCPCCQRMPR